MGQATDEVGNIWEVDAQGNAISLVQAAAASPSQGQIFTLPQSPQQIAAEQNRAAASARADAAQSRAEGADARAAAAADRAQREWDATHEADGTPIAKPKATGGGVDGAKFDSVIAQINRVQELYNSGLRDESLLNGFGLGDLLPTPSNSAFDSAGAALGDQGMAAFKVPGMGPQSDQDAARFVKANQPLASDYDARIEEKLRSLRSRVDANREALGLAPTEWTGLENSPNSTTPAATNYDNPDPLDPSLARNYADPDREVAASGNTRTIRDSEVSSTIDAMMNAGASRAMINAAVTGKGFDPIGQADYDAAKQWMADNPGKKYFGGDASRTEDLSALERLSGSPLGSFLATMGDAATAGTASALAGDKGDQALSAMNALNPNASFAGTLTGGITGAAGAEAALAARAPFALAKYAPRMADALYGGLSGFNAAEEGEGLQGAALGAGVGALGGAAGQRIMIGAGRAIRGVSDPAISRLREAGIPLTFGQAVGQSGPIGAGVKKAEEALVSYPGVGSMVSNRFNDGLEGLQRASFARAAETTGKSVDGFGSDGLEKLSGIISDTYDDALNPNVRLDITDPNVANDIMDAQMFAQTIPAVGDKASNAIEYRVGTGAMDGGVMDGRDFQEAYRGLGRDGRAASRGDDHYSAEFSDATGMAQDALARGLESQNPGAYTGFVAANTANRRAMVLADAIDKAKSQEGGMFTAAQLNSADASSATRLTGRMNSASGNRPFAELAGDAQQVIGNRLANSGTADRALTGLVLGGLAGTGAGYAAGDPSTGAGLGLGATLALMLGGSRAGQQALTGAILNRPAFARALGDTVKRNARIGGFSGAGVLTPLLVGQQN